MEKQNENAAIIEIDQSSIKDFFDEFNDMYDLTITAIETLEDQAKYTPALLNSVFRGVHTIKSNLSMIGLQDLSNIVHQLENILDQIRQNKYIYTPEYGDITRLILDKTKIFADKSFNNEPITEKLTAINHTLKALYENQQPRQEAIIATLKLLDPFSNDKTTISKQTEPTLIAAEEHHNITVNDESYQYLTNDLDFFKNLSDLIEQRTLSPKGKVPVIMQVSTKMNELSAFKVDQLQLQVAIYLYNLGLSTLPISICTKQQPLTEAETKLIKSHSLLTDIFLQNLPYWQPASNIIKQFYENQANFNQSSICDGTKILTIADSFATILYANPMQTLHTRNTMTAILKINNSVGNGFDEYWVDIFNQAVRWLHREHQLLQE